MPPERIRIADTPPPHCSSCFGAKLHVEHVDFGATWDGPTISPDTYDPDNTPYVPIPIDDLIICRDCLAEAARLIGLSDAARKQAALDTQRGVNADLRGQIEAMDSKIRALEQLIRADTDLERRVTGKSKSLAGATA